MQSNTCPLCRKTFQPGREKKLHIDKASPTPEDADVATVNQFLQRMAMVSGENTSEDEAAIVISDAGQWLSSRDDRDHIVVRADVK